MIPDVAKPRSPEQGICDRMKDDIRIAVTRKAAFVRDLDSTEHDWAFAGERMNVEAEAGARAQSSREPLLGTLQIRWPGKLIECRIAFDRRYLHARRPNDRSFVGRRHACPLIIG
jgi:hypothetical protein